MCVCVLFLHEKNIHRLVYSEVQAKLPSAHKLPNAFFMLSYL